MTAQRKALLVLLLAITVLVLAQVACTDIDGSTVTVDSVQRDLSQDARDLGNQAVELRDAVVNGTVEQLSPSWANK